MDAPCVNGAAASSQPSQVNIQVSGPQLLGAASHLMSAQLESLIIARIPPEAIVDLLVGMTATLVARIEQPVIRTTLAAKIAASFENAVRMQEIKVRTTPAGLFMPNGPGKA